MKFKLKRTLYGRLKNVHFYYSIHAFKKQQNSTFNSSNHIFQDVNLIKQSKCVVN